MIRVLIIDDDPDIRTLMDALMKKQGYQVETASRGEEVFDRIESFEPDVILLDVLLSGADGREICKQIKSNEDTRHIQVIMFSAHPGAADNIESYGADHFVSKPVNTQALLKKLDEWVKALK